MYQEVWDIDSKYGMKHLSIQDSLSVSRTKRSIEITSIFKRALMYQNFWNIKAMCNKIDFADSLLRFDEISMPSMFYLHHSISWKG
jgi:hypothetical protein